MTAPIRTNRIMALRTPTSIQHAKGDMDDDMEFATDMEEPVCEGSEDDNHQQERHPHGIMDVFFGFLEIFTN